MRARILVVDDERSIREGLTELLGGDGHDATPVPDGEAALEKVREEVFDLVITDWKMPGMDGLELLRRLRRERPGIQVAVLTGHATVSLAVEAMREGAFEFIEKPFKLEQVRIVLGRALERRKLAEENIRMRGELEAVGRTGKIIGESPGIRQVLDMIDKVAPTPSTVLIYGETGTGKELVARTIHDRSARAERPFVAINCGALPDTLLESELFGHSKGAFTGAETARKGLFEASDGGSLFLDEIGNVSEAMQVKLLRVLEKGELYRVGDRKLVEVDVRIIAATNRDLKEAARSSDFREDLFYRLNVINLTIPPLRDRRGDIPLLASKFLERYNAEMGKAISGFDEAAKRFLMDYEWPGNIRELENCVERAVILAEGPTITPDDLPDDLHAASAEVPRTGTIADMERKMVVQSLEQTGGHQAKAAEILGISARTLRRMIIRYQIEPDEYGKP